MIPISNTYSFKIDNILSTSLETTYVQLFMYLIYSIQSILQTLILGRTSEFDQHILSLFWSLELHNETENFIIPSSVLKKVIYSAYQKNASKDDPLAKFIESGLGGPQFLQNGVYTESGLVIGE